MQITSKLKWNSRRFSIVVLTTVSLFSTSCRNMFTELADKETNAALYYQAQRLIDNGSYTEAIDIIEDQMSAAYAATREVRVTLASAYVGRCGLNFLNLADAIINNTNNSSPLELALSHMKSTTSEADCLQAETILRAASPTGNGVMSDDIDDAFLMTFVSLAKIGAILERVGDTDNDGVINAGFSACTLSAADSRELGSAIMLLYNNIASTGSDIATQLNDVATFCSNVVVAAAGTCAKTDPASYSAAELKAINGVINYDPFGVGSDASYTICP